MSQLELALRKARAAARPEPDAADDPPTSNAAAFVSAWKFDHDPRAASAAADGGSEDVERQAPAATIVRMERRAAEFHGFNPAVREKLAMGEESTPHIREQFRGIAAALYRIRETHPIKIVMVASAVPGEGKTLTAVNLALTLAESYQARVLLVDADLRRPTVHTVFDVPNNHGLKEALVGTGGDLGAIRVSPHLSVLTAGSAMVDPMGALVSSEMREVLDVASAECDWVILDTPPIELLPDANLIGALADIAVLVVQAASTKCELVRHAVEAIGRDRIAGVVLNQMAEPSRISRGYDGYYQERT